MGKPGKTVPTLKKPLGLEMKGSPYSMNQPLHGNAFIGAKVKAEQQGKDSFNVDGKTFPVKKDPSEGPEFVGALLAGAGGFLAKKALPFVAKTILGKGAGTLASKAVAGIGGALKEKMGEGEGGIGFGEKVKNYVGSLDLITNSNADGSLKENAPSTSEDSDKNITKLSGPGDVSTTGQTVGADLKIPNTNISMDKSAVANKQEQDRGIIGGKDYSRGLTPLNKLKKMCRG